MASLSLPNNIAMPILRSSTPTHRRDTLLKAHQSMQCPLDTCPKDLPLLM
jgi:hypothetical protein